MPKRSFRLPRFPQPRLPHPTHIRRSSVRLVTWGLAAFALYLMILFGGMVVQEYRIQQQVAALEEENARLAQDQRNLQDRLAYVRSDAATELQARDQLDMARPEDVVLQLNLIEPTPTVIGPAAPDGSPATNGSPAAPPAQGAAAPNWRRWLVALFGS